MGRLAPCLVSVDPVPAGLVTSREQLRFLVFRGGALGDVLFTLPVLRTLRQSDPSASVEFVAPFPAALLAAYGGAHSVSDLGSAAFVSLFTEDAGLDAALSEKLGHTDCVISYLSDPRGTVSAKIRNCGCQFIPGPFRLKVNDCTGTGATRSTTERAGIRGERYRATTFSRTPAFAQNAFDFSCGQWRHGEELAGIFVGVR